MEGIIIDVEKTTGTQDPYRKEKGELMKDLWAFPKMFRASPPKVEKPVIEAKLDEQVLEFEGEGELKKEKFAYWLLALMDVHLPIIEKYGRYPYRNRGAGRESREEIEWVRKAEGFGKCGAEVGERTRGDVRELRDGIWTPLGGE